MKVMNRLERIAAVVARTEDRQHLRVLNRAFWREYFRQERMAQKSEEFENRRAA